ncbi:MAG: asparagine synthetase B [Theionarchaea archaeon]|nr:asparagine synthetase B [Theionarchaea archaeon]MBU7001023.1 asparagine synthetase B [Theionarchaea archaeon]MBU7020512.1 asparagine synthetase B [Theionarchaea archaeon]
MGELAASMGMTLQQGTMACSHPEGTSENMVCDADLYGIPNPAQYLNALFDQGKDPIDGAKIIFDTVEGGYACAARKDGVTYLLRDPVGLKPLYYCGLNFASQNVICGQPVLPGEVVQLPNSIRYRHVLEETSTDDPAEVLDMLRKTTGKQVERGSALMFSGGIDSTVLAFLTDSLLISCGLQSSQDIANAREAASILERELLEIVVSPQDIVRAIPHVCALLPEITLLNVEIGLLLFFICQEYKGTLLISGQGADELFGGYFKYERAYREGIHVNSMMKRDLENIHLGLERDHEVAEHFSKTIRYPYLNLHLIEAVLGIPAYLHFVPRRKEFLRKMATMAGIPGTLVSRPKKALQYGSGIHHIVKNHTSLLNALSGNHCQKRM